MNSSGTTPISLTGDSCLSNENRCHIATPAPSTPFPYSPLSPYGAINPYSLMSRFSGAGAAHLQSPFTSPFASSLAAGLAYSPEMFHYNPYSALTPTSPLTPSSFWSLTAQQSYHQLNGITFGPTGPAVAYNTNAHLFNLFSPNSLSPMSPSPDLHSPSLYPRVSSLPSPYASSPGLSSAFMSPSSMPLLLSPSLSSSVDRPPTYFSDNTSTPSSTPSMTTLIKCEPTDSTSHHNSHSDKSRRLDEKIRNKMDSNKDKHIERHSKSAKHSLRPESMQKRITTTIITSKPLRDKYSARIEPLKRLEEVIDSVDNDSQSRDSLKRFETSTTAEKTTNGLRSPNKEVVNKDTKDLRHIKREMVESIIECDMSLPLNSVKSVPTCDDINSDSNTNDVIANNTNRELSPKSTTNSIDVIIDDSLKSDDMNLVIDSNGSDRELCTKRAKDAKRESQLKQLQSYRKESHRGNGHKLAVGAIESVDGTQTNTTAISVVLPKTKDQMNGQHMKQCEDELDVQSSTVLCNTSTTGKSTIPAIQPKVGAVEAHPRTQSVIPCRTKPVPKTVVNAKTLSPNQTQSKEEINDKKSFTDYLNDSRSQLSANANKVEPNRANGATKPLPKKPRMSRKSFSATIPVGIAIAQQRTSPKTKSPTDLTTNASQPLKPILPTLSLPVMANSPILITDSPPAGTSLWIKPTPNSTLTNSNAIQANSQFSLSGDFQLARDSLTGHLYLISNSSSLPTTPTTTPKPTVMPPISPLTIKSSEHSKSSPSAIIALPMGATQPQQFFANLGQTQTSTLILDTTNSAPLVQIATKAPTPSVISNAINKNHIKSGRHLDSRNKANNNDNTYSNWLNVERGCQASISDDELSCDNMKTTSTQVDMDVIHSSEEDDESDAKRHKLVLFEERKQKALQRNTSRIDCEDSDDSSRDSIQLQIVDEMASDEPPLLPVKSAPVMQFIDHHGLDLLVDSIEEFAAREESNTPSAELPVNGLQLLSTLALQRSREESDAFAFRRHSTDSSITSNGFNSNQTYIESNRLKRKQRSESCFTTNPIKFDENNEIINDIKKSFKTSSCQTELLNRRVKDFNRFDSNSINLRRSERIFINDSVVSNNTKEVNALDVIKDNDLICNKEFKRKDCLENKFFKSNNKSLVTKFVPLNDELIKTNGKTKDHYVFSGTKSDELDPNQNKLFFMNNKTKRDEKSIFCDINGNNQKSDSDFTKEKPICEQNDKKKKKLSSLSGSISSSISNSSFDMINGDKKVKKRKKKVMEVFEEKKKLKTDSNKEIDDSIESIIKKVSQIDESLNDGKCEERSVEKKTIDNELQNELICEESDESKNDFNKCLFELYDQKRMKLLDETIDEIIANQLIPSEFEGRVDVQNDVMKTSVDEVNKLPEVKTNTESSSQTKTPKPLVKQSSSCSTMSSTSSMSSVSDSCQSSSLTLNLKLTESDLDLKLNVIMLVDGLLFVGQICPIQAPDIYGIVLHGERQHRPIIYSQEEMLREAIREVKPSLDELEEGQRVCAYWSTQYRHLYPGHVRSSSPHPNLVFVEFDDGDNGRIAIDDIRLLPQNYPQMKINADPLKNLERRRRMSSCGNKDNKEIRNAKHNSDNGFEDLTNNSNKELNEMTKSDSNSENVSNTSDIRVKAINGSTDDNSASKSDLKKKKKKHNKDDRHHRHHHNHKHHHCRHHKKCKKHKKWREESSTVSTGRKSGIKLKPMSKLTQKSGHKMDKMVVNKSTKSNALKVNVKENKECQQMKSSSNAQSVLDSNDTNIVENNENRNQNTSRIKTFIKKTPKQRALDRLQTNLSEKFCAITSPVRKRTSNDTNSSASPPTPKKRERMPSAEKSKIAAFLPERQLWHWKGKHVKRTGTKGSRNRKVYYKEIERGREHIRVEDCAVFLSTGRPHLPYIGRIDSMWQTGSGTMIVKVRWFYHPEETKGDPVPLQDKRGALFESSHFDVNDVQTISHKCQVISYTEYQEKRLQNQSILTDDPPNVYYMAGQYEALGGHIDMDPTVPLKAKAKDNKTETSETNTT